MPRSGKLKGTPSSFSVSERKQRGQVCGKERRRTRAHLFTWEQAGVWKPPADPGPGKQRWATLLGKDAIGSKDNEERCAISWSRLVGFNITFCPFIFFFWPTACYFPSHSLTTRLPMPGRHIKTGHPERSRSWNCFSVGRFHTERQAAARGWIGRPRLSAMKCDEPPSFIDMRPPSWCGSWHHVFLIPCSWGGSLTQDFPFEMIHMY